ncbi:MAG: hypothetical protein Q8Q40_13840 [Methylococcaceae bacterium]|nr:hypothetical protein [Methylococcaceae bacterium]MDP3905038.1 hypothetical protein [Methylococcaceae bacterium]
MDFRFKKHLITSALMGGMLLAPEMQAATYTVSQLLNSAGGSTFFNATAINASGQVVGFDGWGYGGITVADLWQPGSATPTVLGSLWGTNDIATAINDGGQVVGYSYGYNSLKRATLWQPGSTTPIELGALGGGDHWDYVIGGNSYATGINASGQVIGYSNSYSGTYGSGGCNYCGIQHAVLWQPGSTTPIDLGTPYNGSGFSQATGINDSGQVVGYGNAGNGGFEAFFWQSSSSTPIAMTSLGGGLSNRH